MKLKLTRCNAVIDQHYFFPLSTVTLDANTIRCEYKTNYFERERERENYSIVVVVVVRSFHFLILSDNLRYESDRFSLVSGAQRNGNQ